MSTTGHEEDEILTPSEVEERTVEEVDDGYDHASDDDCRAY
jgi:hypothetical protein